MSEDIILDDGGDFGPGYPVLKRRDIGEKFVGGLLKFEWRDRQIRDPDGTYRTVLKDNGKPQKEIIAHVLTREATMNAGLGEELSPPDRGAIVRLICSKGAAAQWLKAKETYGGPLKVGLLVAINTTHAVRYNSQNFSEVGQIDTQPDLEMWQTSKANLERKESLGRRGNLVFKENDDPTFKAECVTAYHQLDRANDIALEDPFPGAPVAVGRSDSDFF